MNFDLENHSGTFVTSADIVSADVGIGGETIVCLGHDLDGSRTIDKTDHLQMDVGATRTSDAW